MKLSDELLTSADTKHGKTDWFQQIHGNTDSEDNADTAVHSKSKNTAFKLWHDLTLVVFAMVLICYCYYSTN